MLLAYITCKDREEAKKISGHLISRKLVKCTNMFPMESMYPWKGKLVEDKEFVVLAKTAVVDREKIRSEVKKIHSYEIPCIIFLDADANKEYLDWLSG